MTATISSDGAAAAAVRLHHELELARLRVGRGVAHDLVVVLVLLGPVDAKRQQVGQPQDLGVLDLLAGLLDRLVERNVVAGAQRAHIGLQPTAGNPLLQAGQILRRRVRADEGLVLGAREQAHRLIARRLDLA